MLPVCYLCVCILQMCGRGSVTDLSRGLIKQDKRLEEILIAHIMKETLKVKVTYLLLEIENLLYMHIVII